jgi:hypothetical protein
LRCLREVTPGRCCGCSAPLTSTANWLWFEELRRTARRNPLRQEKYRTMYRQASPARHDQQLCCGSGLGRLRCETIRSGLGSHASWARVDRHEVCQLQLEALATCSTSRDRHPREAASCRLSLELRATAAPLGSLRPRAKSSSGGGQLPHRSGAWFIERLRKRGPEWAAVQAGPVLVS